MTSRGVFRNLRARNGQALAEYVLILFLIITLALVAGLGLLGGTIRGFYTAIAGSF